MNQIANTLIAVLGISRRNPTAVDRNSIVTAPMQQLAMAELKSVVGGDDTSGPRGGWIVAATTAA